ncbi:T9SS type B sorting domain-containing protein [Lutibacter sp. TH_r2]|uniref:T9SS type B sorting domain-containing protein n=1 Tax=Lutibacter sp. TH_r2 TaxID=3082083 RepID=UPI002952A957|nr:T9SS type B sorting domain-containing protein [Lutibacter sp. TH_r2]MDV7187332.1 T9SS type B sorting domain-containing protein [Lutibacter sp. TH_r2]
MKRILFFWLIIIPYISLAQKEAAIWYFGENAGLDFNSGSPVVLTDGQLDTFEGCATISDSNGNLLFYSDGVTVWDRTHTIMPNGTGLLGDVSSTQSAIIIPKPNNTDQYYIFTVDDRPATTVGSNGINYTTIDMTLNGGLGDVVVAEKNLGLLGNAYEKISAINHSDNNTYWVVTFVQNSFYSWRIDATGVNTTAVVSNVSSTSATRGCLKISPDGTKIVCANFGSGQSLRLYDFNDTTGAVSNEQTLTLDENDDIPYGVEFSPDNSKLYATTSKLSGNTHITPGKLIQYDLLSANISTSRVLIHSSNVNTRGGLQLAIDGKIYRALSVSAVNQLGTNFLGVIHNPNASGAASNYLHNNLDISAGDPNRKVVEGLPPFIQSFFRTNIYANDVCFGDATQFNLSSTSIPDSILWDFGDPASGINNTSTLENPTHVFSAPGVYTVTASVTVGLITTDITLEITIYSLPIITSPLTLIQCDNDLDGITDFNLEEANTAISSETPAPTITYFLSQTNAENNTSSIPNPTTFSNADSVTPNTVWARIENAVGCYTTAEVNLQTTSTQIPASLMLNFYECDNDTDGIINFDFSTATSQIETALLPATNLLITYYEDMINALAETNAIDETNYTNTTPTTQQIIVRVDDLNNGCYGLGYHVTLNVKSIPQFDLDTTIEFCANDTNKTVEISNPTDVYDYQWEDSLGTILSNTSSFTATTSGDYIVTATSQNIVGGISCENSKTIQVTINPIPVITTPVTLIQCDDDLDGIVDFNLEEANAAISSETPAPTITYFLDEINALANTNPITNPTSFSNSIATTVWARIENASNCYVTAQVNLSLAATSIPSDLMITFNECDDALIDNNDTNGIKTFDFSSATTTILNELLPETNLEVYYYETIADALAETNVIDPTNFRNSIPFTQEIIVRVDDLNNDCFALGNYITLNVEPLPTFTLQTEVTLCLTSSNSKISVENPQDDYIYEWQNESGISVGNTQEIEVDSAELYTVIVQNNSASACDKIASIQVIEAPITPLSEFSETNLQIQSNSLNNTITILTDNLPSGNLEFALDNGMYQTENIFTPVYGGEHTIYIRDLENCTASQIQTFLISVPNFFTPNFDGTNDTWQISGIEFQPNSNIYIFDRFGKLLKVLDPLGPGWDGLYKGNKLPSTDYWYKIELEDGRVLKGHFSLIR